MPYNIYTYRYNIYIYIYIYVIILRIMNDNSVKSNKLSKGVTTECSLNDKWKSRQKNINSLLRIDWERKLGPIPRHHLPVSTWKDLHPTENLIGDSSDKHIQRNIIQLIGEVVRGALKEYGPAWLQTLYGSRFVQAVGVEPSYVSREYSKSSRLGPTRRVSR